MKGKLLAKSRWFEIRLAKEKADVYLYGEIGWEVTAQTFLDALKATDGPITLHINSIGGSINDGFAIYNTLLGRDVEVVIEGFAASMASIIAMAGKTVRMHEVGLFMVHNPATAAFGSADDFRKVADTLDQVRDLALKAYEKHTSASSEQLIEWMDAETWFTAEQALEAGFIDEVIAPDDMVDIAACAEKFKADRLPNLPALMGAGNPAKQPAALPAISGDGHMTPEEKAALEAAQRKTAADIEAAKLAGATEAAAAERSRVVSITQSFAKYPEHALLAQECITNGVTLAEANAKLLAKLAEKATPVNGTHVEITADVREKRRDAASQWLLFRAGHREDGKPTVVAGDNPFRGARLIDLARMSLELAGVSVSGKSPMEIARLAITHSTADFANALQNALNKTLLAAFKTAGDTWRAFCAVGDLADFRPHYRHIMGSFSDLAAVNEDGEFQSGTLDDTRKETITATTKGRIIGLSHQMIVNDDMGVFTGIARAMGRSAARSVENDVYALLASGSDFGPVMSDAVTLFHANHSNTTSGVLSAATLETARKVLKLQKLPNTSSGVSEYIEPMSPLIFVGPVALEGTAKTINDAQYDPDTANKLQKPNFMRGLLGTIVATPRRDAVSSAVYFLFADPNEIPVIEVGFVQGQQEPQLVMEEAFRQYGVEWRVVYDYGVAAVNYLGCVRSTGA